MLSSKCLVYSTKRSGDSSDPCGSSTAHNLGGDLCVLTLMTIFLSFKMFDMIFKKERKEKRRKEKEKGEIIQMTSNFSSIDKRKDAIKLYRW